MNHAATLASMLADASQSGLYFIDESDTATLLDAGAALQFHVARIDLSQARDKAAVLACFADALAFPTWVGENWDALDDALGDLSWQPAPGYVLLIEHSQQWRSTEVSQGHDGYAMLLKILEDTAQAWRARGVAWWALVALSPEAFQAQA